MYCMKCGLEISEDAVFCTDCLVDMEKYPVNPGTVVLLPRRKDVSPSRKVAKRYTPSLEEQVAALRRYIRILILVLILCVVIIGLMIKPTFHYIRDDHVPIGQNYSTVTPSQPPSE